MNWLDVKSPMAGNPGGISTECEGAKFGNEASEERLILGVLVWVTPQASSRTLKGLS